MNVKAVPKRSLHRSRLSRFSVPSPRSFFQTEGAVQMTVSAMSCAKVSTAPVALPKVNAEVTPCPGRLATCSITA